MSVRQKISAEIARVMALPDIKTKLDALGVQVAAGTPEQLAAWIETEKARWSNIIRRSNIRADQQ